MTAANATANNSAARSANKALIFLFILGCPQSGDSVDVAKGQALKQQSMHQLHKKELDFITI